jgi:uncharacterized membrane protein
MKKFTVIMILSVIATINAWYLTSKAFGYFAGKTFCDINSTWSCWNVVSHPAAFIGPIPFPMVALVVYPVIFLLAWLGLRSAHKKKFYTILTYLAAWGLLFNSYFIAQEAFVIKAFCPLCLLCTWIIIAILIMSIVWAKQSKKVAN